jgi:hypothetical protein
MTLGVNYATKPASIEIGCPPHPGGHPRSAKVAENPFGPAAHIQRAGLQHHPRWWCPGPMASP